MNEDFFEDLSENPTTASLRGLVGADCFRHLQRDFGGRRVYIPHSVGEHHPLAASIGLAGARKICEIYGGGELEISTGDAKAEILRLYRAGVPKARIGHIVGRTRRHVYNILAAEHASQQSDLFSG